MVGFLRGQILSKNLDNQTCVINVNQVGYEVVLTRRLLERLTLNQTQDLWIHTHVREDILLLYGFENEAEKSFFRILISVSGLGPKTALSLLSSHGTPRLIELILTKQISAITEAPGVGKKLAERIVMELTSKVEKMGVHPSIATAPLIPTESQLRRDLVSALTHLGYQPNQVKATLDKLPVESLPKDWDFESSLKVALKEISSHF